MRRVASELCMISINRLFPLSAPYERSINLEIEIHENVFTANFAVHSLLFDRAMYSNTGACDLIVNSTFLAFRLLYIIVVLF